MIHPRNNILEVCTVGLDGQGKCINVWIHKNYMNSVIGSQYLALMIQNDAAALLHKAAMRFP